jgi:probable FeS assembly SUF system protein SufT
VAGVDADAIGKEAVQPPALADDATEEDVEKLVWEQMKTCFDPEIPVNIVDLGLVYSCEVERAADGSRQVSIEMTLTAPGCGMGPIIVEDVRSKVSLIPTIGEVDVELVFEPAWNHMMMSEAARLETGMF